MKFELKPDNRDSSDSDLIKDLIKVAQKLDKPALTAKEYTKSKINRFHSSTIACRFNGWNNALEKAGLKMSVRQNISDKELLEDLKRVARGIDSKKITQKIYNQNGEFTAQTINDRFGWNKALASIGLEISLQQKITNEELFKNLEEIWIKLGKQPGKRDMIKPFSKYSEKPYINKFGTWRKALELFVEFINDEENLQENEDEIVLQVVKNSKNQPCSHKTKRGINLRLRFLVMKRDDFKCKNCGRSPATDRNTILHIDHIEPWSKGGETVLENLQTLCSKCNLGKSNIK